MDGGMNGRMNGALTKAGDDFCTEFEFPILTSCLLLEEAWFQREAFVLRPKTAFPLFSSTASMNAKQKTFPL